MTAEKKKREREREEKRRKRKMEEKGGWEERGKEQQVSECQEVFCRERQWSCPAVQLK